MKKLLLKKSIIALGYFALSILIEIITFLVMGIGVVPQYFLLDLAVITMLAAIIFVLPHSVAQIALFAVLIAVQILLSVTNEALFSMSGMVFGFGMLNLVNELTGVIDSSFLNWSFIALLAVVYAAALTGIIIAGVKIKVQKGAVGRNSVILMLVVLIFVYSFSGATYSITVQNLNSYAEDDLSIFLDESGLYSTQLFPAKAYREFGTFGYYGKNLSNTISSSAVADEVTPEQIDNYFASGRMSNDVYGDNIYTGAIAGKNIVVIVIESGEWYAINGEYTPTLYAMARQGIAMTQFYSRDKTNHSEAMSIMGSYPTVSKLEPEKIVDNDMAYALPNILGAAGYTSNYFHANVGSYYGRENFFQQLYGFDNTYFLDDMTLLDGYAEKNGFYDLDKDSEIFKNYSDEFTYSQGGAFYTQMMTLTTHGKYTDLLEFGNYPFTRTPSRKGEVSGGQMSAEERLNFSEQCQVKEMEEYYKLIDRFPSQFVTGTSGIDEDYLEENGLYEEMFLRYKRFQAGMTDLDLGVNMLVNDLIKDGRLDDTLFFFYADHSAYYNQQNYAMKGIDLSENYNTALYNVPCFMWYGGSMNLNVSALEIEGYGDINFTATKHMDCGLTSGIVDKFTCTFDVVPTLLHLTGYSFNTNLYHGNSIFSDQESLFVSHESGIFTKDIYFSTINIYEKAEDGWEEYDFEQAYSQNELDDAAMDFLMRTKNYYYKQAVLDAVCLNDYFAARDIYSADGQIKFLEKADS